MPLFHHGDGHHKHDHHLPHVGMRKVKSILAIFVGFWIWQGMRLLIPGMEVQSEIKCDRRRVIEYILYPLIKALDETAKEP